MSNWDYESRECGICHRIGYRSFVIYGSEGWRCLNETACARRAARSGYVTPVAQQRPETGQLANAGKNSKLPFAFVTALLAVLKPALTGSSARTTES